MLQLTVDGNPGATGRATVALLYAADRARQCLRAQRASDHKEAQYQRECIAEHLDDAQHHAGAQPLLTLARQHLDAGRADALADLLRGYGYSGG